MKRNALKDLIIWNKKQNRKPLIVWGARQVGKTYLIKKLFAETFYKNNHIYIDLIKEKEICDYCNNNTDPNNIINFISSVKNTRISNNTLLIFDEVQACQAIITSLKYFYQDIPSQPIIVTGSLVRTKIKRTNNIHNSKSSNNLFPVGKINEIYIYPMNYEEFLMNYNENLYNYLINCYNEKKTIDDSYHNLLLKTVYEYMLIGGMPEAVNEYLISKSYFESRETLKDIYNNYLADMDLYQASSESIIRTRLIFKKLFIELNRDSKHFKSGLIEKDLRTRDLKSPLDWLTISNIVYKSYQLKEYITVPLIEDNESVFRLFMSDIGMLSYQSGISTADFINGNKDNTISGVLFENLIANEIASNGISLFYWVGKDSSEFEFILEKDNKIYPIDVKKGKGKLNSLESYSHQNSYEYAIKVSKNKYGYAEDKKILTIPYYMFFLVLKDIY